MDAWEELVRQVLVGNISGNELTPLILKKIQFLGINLAHPEESEKNLLKSISIQSKLYSVAQIPSKLICSDIDLPQKENFKYCNKSRKNQLQNILNNNHDELFTEILEILSEKKLLVPPDLLPELLNLGSSNLQLQRLITKCIGKRGVWLSQFSDKWDYARNYINNDDNIFFYGSIQERINYIKKIHKIKPSNAISLIEKVWKDEGFMVRTKLIKALKESLTIKDEPFLEKAINDSRHEVRAQASALLASLPQSRLVYRMKDLIKEVITYDTSTKSISIELPTLNTAEMKKNGILPRKIYLENHGHKSNQLFQIISKIPPQWWSDFFLKTPVQILELTSKTEWKNIFLFGFIHAAKNFNNEEWIIILHEYYLNKIIKKNNFGFSIEFLYKDMSNDLFNILANQYLVGNNKYTFSDNQPIVSFLLTEDQKWDDIIAKKVIHRIKQTILEDAHVFHWSLKSVLKRAGFAISPLLYDIIKQNWPTQSYAWNSWKREVDHFLSVLKFRWEIANLED
ncbi:DUF5691 domain-containing protein [Aureispira]|nr:DUF5691 domain-containing protein [Aureispira sp.]